MKVHAAGIRVLGAMLSLVVGACGADQSHPKGGLKLDFTVTDQATAADAGLPLYPGSKPYVDDSDDSNSAATIRLATPLFGFNVVAMELETADELERVAAFYRQALSKYGHILDCSDERDTEQSAARSDELTCDPGDSETHRIVYKVGTEKHQRVVAISPHGSGTRFSLVRLDMRDDSKQ